MSVEGLEVDLICDVICDDERHIRGDVDLTLLSKGREPCLHR